MIKKPSKPELKQIIKRQSKQVGDMGVVADAQLDRHFFGRLSRLGTVKRFVIGWVGLILLLMVALLLQANALEGKYQQLQPSEGGIFTEGIVGDFTNADPLYATDSVDSAVSRLIFAGLFEYDDDNKLVPNLAEKIELDKTAKIYTVTLKPDLKWQDGQKLTSDDVVFTYQLIQNPDSRSYMQSSWTGIKIEAKDERTVVFTLPNTLSAFPQSLTNGLVPKHILEKVAPEQMRSNEFNNTRPIGAGPFKFETLEVDRTTPGKEDERISLVPFSDYHKGAPKIDRFIIKTFQDQKAMEQGYNDKQVTAISGLTASPDKMRDDPQTHEYSLPLAGQVMVFFKNSEAPFKDPRVRNALVLGVNRQKVIESTGYPLLVSDSPLLRSQIGYDAKLVQKTNNQAQARKILDQAGWKVGENGVREQNKNKLTFRLYTEANSEYAAISHELQKQWRDIGVDAQVTLQTPSELKATASSHNYGAFMTAISTGADPDVYAYWHSSQNDVRSRSRLNFSEYDSPRADAGLEAGRTRSDPTLRSIKYRPFLESWLKDNPALALYQPRYLFVVHEPFYNFNVDSLVTPNDRYNNVHNWMIKESRR